MAQHCYYWLPKMRLNKWDLPVLGRIVDSEWAGLDPAQMGLGPVHAMTPIMKRHKFTLDDIDYWEINESLCHTGTSLSCCLE